MNAGRIASLLVVACVAGGTGCSSFPDLKAGVEFDALKPFFGAAKGHRILIAPVIEERASREGLSKERGEMRLEGPEFQRELIRALERIVGEQGSDGKPVVRVAEAAGSAAEQAWQEGYDLIVEARVRRWDATFVETNGWWFPNALFLGWYFWPIGPQWLIADEVYGVDCEVTLSVLSASSERPLPMRAEHRQITIRANEGDDDAERDRLDVLAAPRFAFDDLDRGLDLFGTWFTGDLDADQWDQVGGILEPYARRSAALRIAARVADAVARFDSLTDEEKEETLAATHALVVGISGYEDACVGADQDAEEFALLLTGELPRLLPEGVAGEVAEDAPRVLFAPTKNVRKLINGRATGQAIRDGLEAIRTRAMPQDILVFFFAGRGVRMPGKAGLEGLGLIPHGESEAIPLPELAAALQEIPSRRRVVVLDVDFEQGQRGRGSGDPLSQLDALLREAFLKGARGGAVVLAGAPEPGEEVQAYEERGLLTQYVVRGLQGAADQGGDGLSYEDLGAYLTRHVLNLSEVALPKPQRPRVIAVSPRDLIR
jgi:hypothetical protein